MRLHDPCAMVLESRIWKGQQGEQWAVAHLERLGHRILARNWRWRRSELDIVSRHGDTTVFVEVKCRSRCGDTTDPRGKCRVSIAVDDATYRKRPALLN